MASNPFKRHRFSARQILLAVRWYCRFPLSYRDVADLLAERGIHVSPSTIHRWVIKFGPEIARRIRKQHYPRTMRWHIDETYIRVCGKWRYLWRIIDQKGRFVDFRLTDRRDSNAANAFMNQAWRNCGLYPPASIVTDKAPTYRAVVESLGEHPYFNRLVEHIVSKWRNNRIESDHAALKRIISPAKGYKSLRCAKANIRGIESLRTLKRGDVLEPPRTMMGEIDHLHLLFGVD